MANIYKPLFDSVNDGVAVLTAGKIHESIPTIHDVGSVLLPTDTPVEHARFGLFMAKVCNENINFDGGGAMTRVEDGSVKFSWTRLYATRSQLEAMQYPMEAVRDALVELMNNVEDAEDA